MRDALAWLAALFLLFVALVLTVALQAYRYKRDKARAEALHEGRTIVAEVPSDQDLTLVAEDERAFYHGESRIPKKSIRAVRLLLNDAAILSHMSKDWCERNPRQPGSLDNQIEGLMKDRWAVEIESIADTDRIECGSIRERVSQELAMKIYLTVKRTIDRAA